MDGVGGRLGRSSTRYGPATVFNGPVRKWKKNWVHVSTPNSKNNNNNNRHHNKINEPTAATTATTTINANNVSHLLLYKWTPLSQGNCNNNDNSYDGDKNSAKDEVEEPPRRKFRYIPISLLEESTKEVEENEDLEKVGSEDKQSDTNLTVVSSIPKSDDADDKPDIDDTLMEEIQDDDQEGRQDLNKSTLDLSLG